MRILNIVPSFKVLGGVANHYMGLAPFWKNEMMYCTYGKRINIPAIFTLLPDFICYIFKLIFSQIDVVIVNPSLRTYQLRRDAIYILLAKLFRKKVVTFIHGWDFNVGEKIIENPTWFRRIYGKSMFIYVLCSDFKKQLEQIKVESPILLTTTKVADNLVEKFEIGIRKGKIDTLLFLARVEKYKGIDITLEVFQILKNKYPYLKLSVCGIGTELKNAKQYVSNNNIQDVTFYGNVSGEKLISQFINSDLYILPTYGEGMATSVLEAMAFGLPVITRPVGGVKDFFVEGKIGGFLLSSFKPEDYAMLIEKLIKNPQLTEKISKSNYEYAINHFLASAVTKRYEKDLNKLINAEISKHFK